MRKIRRWEYTSCVICGVSIFVVDEFLYWALIPLRKGESIFKRLGK
jgi:hypothetical protein